MGRDKSKDDKYFNCNQEHEFDYVSNLYHDREAVYKFLKRGCRSARINYSTHMKVYELIEEELGYKIPSESKPN